MYEPNYPQAGAMAGMKEKMMFERNISTRNVTRVAGPSPTSHGRRLTG